MWKSVDGIQFSNEKCIMSSFLCNYHYDTQNVGVVEENNLKIYIRTWKDNHSNRKVSVGLFDLNGNMLTYPMGLKDDYLYNSAASKMNEKYDLLFPTYFNNSDGDDSAYIKALIVNEYDSKEILCNINDWIGDDEPWALVSPGIITINGEKYIAYTVRNWSHDSTIPTNGKTCYKLIKIVIDES